MSEEDIRAAADEAEEFDPNDDGGQAPPSRLLNTGSDVEIAQFLTDDLNSRFGQIVFCEVGFLHYTGTHCGKIPEHELELGAQRYDGMAFRHTEQLAIRRQAQ
jgi:hypothetical protein